MLNLKLSLESHRTLIKLQQSNLKIAKRIVEKLDQLADDPQSIPSKTLTGHASYKRFRTGDYRVVFAIKGQDLLVFIIDHRSKVYLQLEKHTRKVIFGDEE
jgi:mRNA-degrading endonuclease RelE of RelBE toxin-antitoxin system